MKVLIVRFSSIGDIVLTTPVVRCLRLQQKEVRIHYLTRKAFKPLLEANPYIDRLHLLEDNWAEMVEELKQEQFDLVIDLHHNLKTLRLKRALGVNSRAFHKLNIEKWLLVNFKIDRLPEKHIVDRYLETVASLGVVNDGNGLDYHFPPDFELLAPARALALHGPYNALVIGAKYATKRMPNELLGDIIAGSELPVVLLGGPEDSENGAQLHRKYPSDTFNACGKFDLHGSAALLKGAQKVVTNDTGLMHIASALQRPIASVWGNTVPKLGMNPYYPASLNTDNQQIKELISEVHLPCRPCSKIGYGSCPKGHFKCMRGQSGTSIVSWLNS